MKVTEKKKESCQMAITVEIEKPEVEEYLQKAYRKLVAEVKIPGFRKGKAPRSVLESHVGKDALLDTALEEMLPKVIQDLLEEEKVAVFARPTAELLNKEPVTFKTTLQMPPEVKLGDYQSISLKPRKTAVKKAEVDAIMEQLRAGRATWEPVERAAKFNDLAIIDVKGNIGELVCIDQKDAQYPVRQDAVYPAPGFPDQLTGMKRGQEKEFKLSFPPDFSQPALAGKEVEFKVKLLEVKEEKLPELNDALATEIDPEFKTLAELRQRVEDNMKLRAEEKARRDFETELVDEAVKISKVEYPPILVEAEIDNLVSRQLQELQRHVSSQEEFNRKLAETPPEKIREAQRPEAEERVTRALVLGKIASQEGLRVDEKDIKGEIDFLTKDIPDIDKAEAQRKALNTPENLNQIYNMLLTRKTIDLLTERAKGTAKKAVPKKTTAGETKPKTAATKTKPAAKKTATTAKSKKSKKEAE